jgi:formate dehydrogenase beta subunit
VADAVNARLGGGYGLPGWVMEEEPEVVPAAETNRAYFRRQTRAEDPHVPETGTAGALAEETMTLAAADALAEIERCYSCGYCNHCGTCFVFCPDVAIGWADGPVFDYDFCKGCGICVTECPGHVLLFVREKGDE